VANTALKAMNVTKMVIKLEGDFSAIKQKYYQNGNETENIIKI
jgi:hypothetical protein